MADGKAIGRSVPRQDAVDKVTGAAQFVDDIQFGPTLLHAKILRSPHPHARIVAIDTAAAMAVPGVRAIVTGKDCPQYLGLYLADRTVYAVDRVRFVGEPVAGVAADSAAAATEAIGKIVVAYEPLPGIFDPVAGAGNKDVLLHENLGTYRCAPFIYPVPGTNIANRFRLRKGDTDKGFAAAAAVVENTYTVPHIQHSQLEPHAAAANFDRAGKLTLWSSSQSPNAVRKLIATAFGLPMTKLRVITPYVGGGFGGKAGLTCEALVVPLALRLPGHHVKLTLTREEVFRGTFVRQGLVARLKTGAGGDGRLAAMEAELFWDGGAYAEYGVNIARSGGYCSSGPYEIPNIKTDSCCVYTNHPVGGPMRGFGMPEIHWGIEQQMDMLAEKLGLDPLAFRRLNALRDGSPAAFGGPMSGATLVDTIDAVAARCGWGGPKPPASGARKARGRGLACMFKAPSMPPDAQSSAVLKLNEDGTVHILTTAMEIGQGSLTALAQIAAEELGVPVADVVVTLPDTDYTPYEWQTVASRISYSAGNAVLAAARDAKAQLLAVAAQVLAVPATELAIEDGRIFPRTDPARALAVSAIAMGCLLPGGAIGGPVVGRGAFVPAGITGLDRETGQGERPAPFWTYGTQVADVEVDLRTGAITVLKVTAAYEVGKVINPALAIGQVQGGIVQGLGAALYERLALAEGKYLNSDFVDYKIPTATDTPQMDIVLLETSPQADGPFGVKGIAEPTMVPTAPAIANAVYDAIGVRIRDLPLSAEKVLAALKSKQAGEKFVRRAP